MSNTQVGAVYSKIMDEVIGQCRAAFEEEGAPSSVLDDFKKSWQEKVSERKVADMPWDPKPAPPPPAAQPPPQPRAAAPYVPPQPQQPPQADVKVKLESTDLANLQPQQQFTVAPPQDIARQRAAEQMRAHYGDSAAASIAQLQQQQQPIAEAPHGVKRPLAQSSPTNEQFDVKRQHIASDYNRGQTQFAQQRMHQVEQQRRQAHPTLGAGQTDGAAEWAQMVAERRALAAEGFADADKSIAERIAALQRIEDRSIMQPHSQQKKIAPAVVVPGPSSSGPAGFDGADDDDDEEIKESPAVDDADAINSELDDDEDDDALVEEDDDKAGEIMVCTYEKVARVKNKWKCVLKDGILVTGGKEYVFGKATGEFEW